MSKEIKLQLTALHPAQLGVIQQAKRFNVVCCGRRWGKTVLGMDRLIHPALQGKPVAWFAPNYRLLSDVWRELQVTLEPVIARTNQQERRLELRGGGVLEMWSLDSPDSGRGRAYALAVVDECALVPNLEQAWLQTIRPMLTDYCGEAWFLSTPKGMNYFRALFDRGQDPERKEWASWQMPTVENPRLDPDEIESARQDLTEAAFNQEYLALFVNWEGSVFRRVGEAATATPKTEREAGHNYVIGCDWGRSNDYTVFLVVDVTARAVVALQRSKRVDYTLQCERLKVLSEQWQPQQIIAEQNSIGQPIIEQLTRDGLRIDPFTTTNASKAQVIESLALAFERSDIRILNDPVLVGELVAYQTERLPSGLLRYGAPSGQHDDTVMALAMAWSAVSGQRRMIYQMPDSAIVVKDFPIPDHWPRAYGLDVRWLTAAAIWGARDPESDVLYLYSEYVGEAEAAVHVATIRGRGVWIPGLIDSVANSRNQVDGGRLIQMYRSLGLVLQTIDNPLESGVLNLWQRMHSGRLKVFASLSKYFDERRLYRRDEKDQIVREHDNLQDAARCLVNGITRLCTKPVKTVFVPHRQYRGERSWMI
jgi:hypothetical protein